MLFFIIYWLYRFLIFLYRYDINELKPNKHALSFNSEVKTLIFIYCVYRPYLTTYYLLYKSLSYCINYKKIKFNNKVRIIHYLPRILILILKYLIGLPLRVIKDTFIWSRKWVDYPISIYVSKTLTEKLKDRSLDISCWVLWKIKNIESYRILEILNL